MLSVSERIGFMAFGLAGMGIAPALLVLTYGCLKSAITGVG